MGKRFVHVKKKGKKGASNCNGDLEADITTRKKQVIFFFFLHFSIRIFLFKKKKKPMFRFDKLHTDIKLKIIIYNPKINEKIRI